MSKDMVYEDVPILLRRQGDHLIAGQNNSTILLGRDRVTGTETGYGSRSSGGKGAGSMHLIVGRKGQDISPDDSATVYLSSKTDPDTQAGTDSVGEPQKEKSAVVMRADCMRMTARTDFKLSVGKAYISITSAGEIVVEGDVQLGKGAADRLMRGDEFAKFWSTLVIPTPAGPSGFPPPIPQSVFSPRNRVK